MDFVKHLIRGRSEDFYLRFSKYSTVAWAGALVLVAYLSREVAFVLNAAFSLRGLTSGALLGGLFLAVFRPAIGARPVVFGMCTSLAVMTAIQWLPKLAWTRAAWQSHIGAEVFWPWYTLTGTCVTLLAAAGARWVTRRKGN
jgi:hypothetical protein